jgi:predicted RNase H-like HicB family nuclease
MTPGAVAYAVVIEKAGRNYSAYAPDLPGVITTGPTPEATERNMREAIAFHLQELRAAGEPIPAPSREP